MGKSNQSDCDDAFEFTTRVGLYARVSTLIGQDPEMQLSELREYAERRGWTVQKEYVDRGISGSMDSRPALNDMMLDARRRRLDCVLVWKIDRFGRSLKHLVTALADLSALGVSFVSLRDQLDLTTPSGRLMFQIIGAMAEFERATRRTPEPLYGRCGRPDSERMVGNSEVGIPGSVLSVEQTGSCPASGKKVRVPSRLSTVLSESKLSYEFIVICLPESACALTGLLLVITGL